VYLQCLEKLHESVLHIKTKKKVHIGNTCPEMSDLDFTLTLSNILLTTDIIHLKYTFKIE